MSQEENGIIAPDDFGTAFLFEPPKKIYGQFNTAFQKIIPFTKFEDIVTKFNQGVSGYYVKHISHLGEHTHYLWLDDQRKKALSVYFDSNHMIDRLVVQPYITFKGMSRVTTKVSYSMPVDDEWLVFWGGEDEFINYHYPDASQRYAYDLLIMHEGKTYQGDPSDNTNYYAFDKKVTAPADGRIVKIVNDIEDNVPGEMIEKKPAGNYIIIEHAKREYSLTAHLKKGSVEKKVGDVVKQGDMVARCGNSGNTSEPHIHFQVMNIPKAKGGQSLKIQFDNGSDPLQGDTVTRTPRSGNGELNPLLMAALESKEKKSMLSIISSSLRDKFSRK